MSLVSYRVFGGWRWVRFWCQLGFQMIHILVHGFFFKKIPYTCQRVIGPIWSVTFGIGMAVRKLRIHFYWAWVRWLAKPSLHLGSHVTGMAKLRGPNHTIASQANSATSSSSFQQPIWRWHVITGYAHWSMHQHPLLVNFMKPRTLHRSSETDLSRSYTSAIRVWAMTWLASWLPCGASVFIYYFDTCDIEAS